MSKIAGRHSGRRLGGVAPRSGDASPSLSSPSCSSARRPERPRARAHTGKTNQQARNHRAIAPTSQRASWLCRATRRISRSAEHIVQKSSTRPSTVIREAQMTVSGFIRRPVRSRWYETGPMSAAAVAEPSITVTT